jgi:predicted transcriptional regulator with HTH domain
MMIRKICHSRESGERSDRKVNPWTELSAKWFAQRHEGIKKLLRVFVSSCEPKSCRVRKYKTMGSRFRGNDNVGVLGCVNGYSRRPELFCASTPAAPGSILPLVPSGCVARWMLKQVQHDVGGSASLRPPRFCVNTLTCHSRESGNPWAELSAKWFAQRHEGIKKLLPVFVSSCELKSFSARQYRTIDSRFRGNDNFGVLGCVSRYPRRPSAGWGPSRLSAKWFAQRREGIKKLLQVFVSSCEPKTYRVRKYKTMGSRFRGNDNVGVLGCVNGYACRPSAGWGLSRLSAKWFAQRHEGIKRLLPVFVSSCEPKTYRVRKYKTMGSRFRGNDNLGVLGCVNGYSCRPSAGWGLSRLSAKWFAQRHEGIKRLLLVFVSSCELKSFSARQYRTIDSRFRGNDNVWVLGGVT